ncbi:uncharacterized protein BJ212DRAFT_1298081 [Suillus subaureus]|uniref:Uncharacterized protein n=1 Tax=Suillus subaureus TaxID=48587 RepID=A0A9P7EEM2_9AGAM|nr:uncharacterized protein BJ212DRAFT_1298081 [Suillus subaureus]KAG1819619.1 hypothetical protein BJ212DRAFT_1298081 [Suillus subaureus]
MGSCTDHAGRRVTSTKKGRFMGKQSTRLTWELEMNLFKLTQCTEVTKKEKEKSRNILCSWKKKISQLEHDKKTMWISLTYAINSVRKTQSLTNCTRRSRAGMMQNSLMAEEALISANKEEQERHLTIEHTWAEEQIISSELEHVNLEHATAIETTNQDLNTAHQESAELCNTIEDLQNDNETLKTKLLNMEEESMS